MKDTSFFLTATAILFICTTIYGQTKDGYFIKHKEQHKVFKHVRNTDTLSVLNSFGNIEITAWDKDEIVVDIINTGIATTTQHAQDILNSIVIRETTNRGCYSFATSKRNPQHSTGGINGVVVKGRTEKWESNTLYKIKVPVRMVLNIDERCGDVVTGDLAGPLTVAIHMGAIHAGKLTGPGNRIYVDESYGYENTITAINEGSLTCNNACALSITRPINRDKVKTEGWAPLMVNGVKQ